jgi:hypothetical protein
MAPRLQNSPYNLEKFLETGSGYVLGFTGFRDTTFGDFFLLT